LWRLPLQQFAYRQLMYLVLIQSATTALTGGRLGWHKLHRAGLHSNGSSGGGGGGTHREVEVGDIPVQVIAPVVDTWPPTLDQTRAPRHPAAGRAQARPALPQQPVFADDLEPRNMPSAGSPPGGGSGPVYTG
jgi:hypothetical protein